ncbi:zinc finger protein 62-like [Penaeus japonicus]|uniref:zinc finger protein 62-like n=1 Tax=Penaeus japonicus TaxID=27405 RepID=UPI001C712B7C|nr:zinc finger protein 62-like [Penaeus japonicus]
MGDGSHDKIMFHRFHDLKTGQDPDIMSGGSRSSTPAGEPGDGRPMFPLVPRPDLNTPSHQIGVTPQYPSTTSPAPGFVSQGASLMALGHNVMFSGSKLMSGPAHEAHRYMTEAYRLAAGDAGAHRMSYSTVGIRPQSEQQSLLAESHRSNVSSPSNNSDRGQSIPQRQSEVDRSIYNPANQAPQVNMEALRLEANRIDSSRPEASSPRTMTNAERVSHSSSSSRLATPKTEGDGFQYSKNPYSHSHAPQQPSQTSKNKSGVGPHMFPVSFSPYHQYSDEGSAYKRHFYDDARRELESVNPTDQLLTASKNRDHAVTEKIVQELSRFESCVSQDLYQHVDPGKDEPAFGQVSASTSAHPGVMPRPKMCKGRQPKIYKCELCHQEFKNSTQLKNHAWRHTGEKPFACHICQATFTQQSNLKTHLRIHTGERPYTCEECNSTFTQISNLRTHQKIHTGEKPYECDICFTRFSQQSNLKSHKLIHSGERPFKCDECGSCFVQSTHLRNHKRIHTNERPYACEQCGAKFRQLSNLKTHEKIHTGERPFVCEDCGSAFAQKSNLKSHRIKLHSADGVPNRRGRKKKLEAIRPFTCEQCGAKFTMMSNLKIHLRLHTGEKPYQCQICGASFAQRSNLKTHEHTHTDERPYRCQECPAAFRQKTNLKTHKMKKHPVKSLKIKILQDSQYIMQDLLQGGGEEGPSHIEEPIVQIREGEREHLHLLEGACGVDDDDDSIKSEEEEYHSQEGPDAGDVMHRTCKPYTPEANPYDSQSFQ